MPEQGGLADAVGADDADPVAADDGGGEAFDDRRVSPGKTRLLSASTTIRPLRSASWIASRETPILLLPSAPAPAASACRARTLPSLRVRRALIPCLIQTSSLASFLSNVLPLPLLRFQQGLTAVEIRPVIAGEGKEAAPVDLHDARRQALEKGPVVGHEHERPFVPQKEFLEPEYGVDVQMVGRLVEKQEVRIVHEGPARKTRRLRPADRKRNSAFSSSSIRVITDSMRW